jgi:hypothetical protein
VRRRTWITVAIILAVLAALAVAVYLRKKAPPEAARLLPEADAIVYFNLKPLRALTHFDQHPVQHDPDYQAFINATGIQFERDLDEAAFAIHRMADPNGPNGAVAYSEIFVGRFNGPRLTRYLATLAADTENYAGHTIYRIPHEGRNVRVALLGYDMVAVSNTPTPEQMHSMIDRYHMAALPFSGPTLLAQHYPDVPLLSQVWGIGKIGLPFADGHHLQLFGMPLPLPADTTFIASVRFLGSLRLRIEEIAPTDSSAQASTQVANFAIKFFLSGLTDSASSDATQGRTLADLGTFLRSATVQQKGNRAILRAVIPISMLEDLAASVKSTPTPADDSAGTSSNPQK